MVYETRWGEGNLPMVHMGLLAASPERVLALRMALAPVIGPDTAVLDAGCGSLGVLSIIAAKLGARRVVAVDIGDLDAARALARENGVADRITWIRRDLAELDDSVGAFDVIVAMVYNNHPVRDLAQQRLVASLAERFARPGAALIPDTVRYSVAGYCSTAADTGPETRRGEWTETLERIEGYTGISLRTMRDVADPLSPRKARDLRPWLGPGALSARFGYVDRRGVTQLTEHAPFTEIDYHDPATARAYPESTTLRVIQPGRLDATIWRQDLCYGDLLIRSTETMHPVHRAHDVRPGDSAVLSTGSPWKKAIPLTIRPAG